MCKPYHWRGIPLVWRLQRPLHKHCPNERNLRFDVIVINVKLNVDIMDYYFSISHNDLESFMEWYVYWKIKSRNTKSSGKIIYYFKHLQWLQTSITLVIFSQGKSWWCCNNCRGSTFRVGFMWQCIWAWWCEISVKTSEKSVLFFLKNFEI